MSSSLERLQNETSRKYDARINRLRILTARQKQSIKADHRNMQRKLYFVMSSNYHWVDQTEKRLLALLNQKRDLELKQIRMNHDKGNRNNSRCQLNISDDAKAVHTHKKINNK